MTVAEFISECDQAAAAQVDLTPLFDVARATIIGAIRGNFDRQTSPSGSAWPPRKDPASGDHPLLNKTGALMSAATGGDINEVRGDTLEIGVDANAGAVGSIRGAAAHNYGYPPNNLPQREFMGLSEETVDRLAEQAADIGAKTLPGNGAL
jgi:phage gpG-like protein